MKVVTVCNRRHPALSCGRRGGSMLHIVHKAACEGPAAHLSLSVGQTTSSMCRRLAPSSLLLIYRVRRPSKRTCHSSHGVGGSAKAQVRDQHCGDDTQHLRSSPVSENLILKPSLSPPTVLDESRAVDDPPPCGKSGCTNLNRAAGGSWTSTARLQA